MATPFEIKESDSRPTYIAVLKSSFGLVGEAPINLTTATGVKFIMRDVNLSDDDPPKVDSAMTITDAVNGIVSYTFTTTDTDTSGTYNVEFQITWSDGGIETIPNNSYLQLIVYDDLGA
jgi:hypothetical protein